VPDEKIDKLAAVQKMLFDLATSCEVAIKINNELPSPMDFSVMQERLQAAEWGLDMVEWMKKYKRQRLIDGERD
jgi:hypothetical protein